LKLVLFLNLLYHTGFANDNLYSPSRFFPLYSATYLTVNNNKTLPLVTVSDQRRAIGVGMSAFSLWPQTEMLGVWSAKVAYATYYRALKGVKMSHINYTDSTSLSSGMVYFHQGFSSKKYNSFHNDITLGIGGLYERAFFDSLPLNQTELTNNRWGLDFEGVYSFRADLDLFSKYVAGYVALGTRCRMANEEIVTQMTEFSLLRAEAYTEVLLYSYRVLPFTRYVVPSLYAQYEESEFINSRFNASCYYSPNYHWNFSSPVFFYLLGASSLLLPTELSADYMNMEKFYVGAGWHLENFIGFIKKQDPNRTPWRLSYHLRFSDDFSKPVHEISLQLIRSSAKMQSTRNTVY